MFDLINPFKKCFKFIYLCINLSFSKNLNLAKNYFVISKHPQNSSRKSTANDNQIYRFLFLLLPQN